MTCPCPATCAWHAEELFSKAVELDFEPEYNRATKMLSVWRESENLQSFAIVAADDRGER